MAWDASKPPNSGYLQSAEIRANMAAIEDQALGPNLLGDPEYKIWAAGITGAAPSWWNLSGQTSSGNISKVASTTAITIPGNNIATKLTYAAELELYQNVLSTGDITTSIRKALDGQTVSACCWLWSDSNSCKLNLHGPSSNVLSSAVPASTWTWMKRSFTLASSTIARLGMGVNLAGAGDAYIAQPVLVFGPIAPDYPTPAVVTRGTIGTVLSGDPVGLTTDADGAFVYSHQLPFIVERVDMRALTAVTTANFIVDAQHDTGTSWVSLFSATSNTTKPQLSATSSVKSKGAVPDGGYQYRCFAADTNGSSPANSTVNIKVIQASGTGGKNPTIKLRSLSYNPPLQSWRAVGNYK